MSLQSGPDNAKCGSTRLVVRRVIQASPAFLFDAWTLPALLLQWWGPNGVICPEAHVDLRPGGELRIANLLPDGAIVWIRGSFEQVDPPRLLVYSWQLGDTPSRLERVTVRFNPLGPACEVVVVHERIPDVATRERHAAGWRGCLDGLERLAASSRTGPRIAP